MKPIILLWVSLNLNKIKIIFGLKHVGVHQNPWLRQALNFGGRMDPFFFFFPKDFRASPATQWIGNAKDSCNCERIWMSFLSKHVHAKGPYRKFFIITCPIIRILSHMISVMLQTVNMSQYVQTSSKQCTSLLKNMSFIITLSYLLLD